MKPKQIEKKYKIVKTDWGYAMYDISKPAVTRQIGAAVGIMFMKVELSAKQLETLELVGEIVFVDEKE